MNEKEATRYIPVKLRRELLAESGYRCTVPTCKGTSALQFEHIEDWASMPFKNHHFDKMIILCATCHARVTSKEIHKDAIKGYKRNLAVLNGRYTLYEIRLLKSFHDYFEATKRRETISISMTIETRDEHGTVVSKSETPADTESRSIQDLLEGEIWPSVEIEVVDNSVGFKVFHTISYHDRLHIAGLIHDNLVSLSLSEKHIPIMFPKGENTGQRLIEVTLTSSGRELIERLYTAKPISQAT